MDTPRDQITPQPLGDSRRMESRTKVTAVVVRGLTEQLEGLAKQGPGGRAAAIDLLQTMDRGADFSPSEPALFQDLLAVLGVATPHPIGIPANDAPYWLRGERLLGHDRAVSARVGVPRSGPNVSA